MKSRGMGVWLLTIAALFLPGCVTTSSGGMPGPAEASVRVQAQLDLARGYLEQGNMERARASLNKGLSIDPEAVEVLVLLGVLNAAEREWGLAERDFKKALAIEPDNPQALNNYASFLYAQQRYDEAVRYLKQLVKDPDYRARSQAYENLGLAQLKVNDVAAAKEAFSRALQLSFAQSTASLELAEISYDEGNFDGANEFYAGYLNQARQTPRSLCLGMKLAGQEGDSNRLASYALALNNLFPDAPETSNCIVP